jgi:hypothetical protein
VLLTYGMGILKFIPMGLKSHFKNLSNVLDVVIFTLAAITVPMWLTIIVLHSRTFEGMNTMQLTSDTTNTDWASDIVLLSQNEKVYRIG